MLRSEMPNELGEAVIRDIYTPESLQDLEQAVINQQEEIAKLKARLRYVERDTEVWTSRFDELIQEMRRQQSEAAYSLAREIERSFGMQISAHLLQLSTHLKVITELLNTAESIVEHWEEKQNSRE